MRSPTPPASPPEWWDVAGKRTIVAAETKLALLEALRLPARTQRAGPQSLARLVAETARGALPYSLRLPVDGALEGPAARRALGAIARRSNFTSRPRTARAIGGRSEAGEGRRRTLADGREIARAISICRHCRSAGTGSRSTASPAR